jgi:hypothetical protein
MASGLAHMNDSFMLLQLKELNLQLRATQASILDEDE